MRAARLLAFLLLAARPAARAGGPGDPPWTAPSIAFNLGLTELKPAREDLRVNELFNGPQFAYGRPVVKAKTVSARVLRFTLDVGDAYNKDEHVFGDHRYLKFFILNGQIEDHRSVRQAASRGEIFCEIALLQPRSLWGKEASIEIPSQEIAQPFPGGRTCLFCGYGEADELRRLNYWTQGIQLREYSFKPDDRSVLDSVACAKPSAGGGYTGTELTVGDFNRGLSLMRQPIVVFYTDYPDFQAP